MATRKRNEEEQQLWDTIEEKRNVRRSLVAERDAALALLDKCATVEWSIVQNTAPTLGLDYVIIRREVLEVEKVIRQLDADYKTLRTKNDAT